MRADEVNPGRKGPARQADWDELALPRDEIGCPLRRDSASWGWMGSQLQRALAADRATDRRSLLVAVLLHLAFGVVRALSVATELRRGGAADAFPIGWINEMSSALLLVSLVPAVGWFTRRVPSIRGQWSRTVPLYFAASLVYSALHVAGMVALRKLAYPLGVGSPYIFFGGTGAVLRESVYEYRKDLLTFLIVVGMFELGRVMAEQARELAAARAEARQRRRLTLKCGGTTHWIDAGSVIWVRAAGNYVEVRAGEETHLARTTMTALEEQLREAGATVGRVHRSWLINLQRIASVSPAGDGNVRIRMDDGSTIPGSRRYRDRLPRAAPVDAPREATR